MADKLEKAYLTLTEPSQSGGGGGGRQVRFQFNPKEVTVQKSSNWETKPVKGAHKGPKPEFKGAEPGSMTVELFLDGTGSTGAPAGDISKDVETLFECCGPTKATMRKNQPAPPLVRFFWGGFKGFTAFVKQVNVKYTLFEPGGKPTRATVSLTLQEIPQEVAKQNPTSGGLAPLRTHTMVAGDTLQSVAYREYGDPARWRALAEANAIDDPLRVRPGTLLMVPPPEQATLRS